MRSLFLIHFLSCIAGCRSWWEPHPFPSTSIRTFDWRSQRVEAAITPRTKMIIVNSPANPTGVSFHANELQQLATLAADRDICLISDEIYSKFVYDRSACVTRRASIPTPLSSTVSARAMR